MGLSCLTRRIGRCGRLLRNRRGAWRSGGAPDGRRAAVAACEAA
jgi:hypothetical protein